MGGGPYNNNMAAFVDVHALSSTILKARKHRLDESKGHLFVAARRARDDITLLYTLHLFMPFRWGRQSVIAIQLDTRRREERGI